MTNRKYYGVAILALTAGVIGPHCAFAQTAAPDASSPSVAEVVVTAQKRSEKLVDVPISVSVSSGEALKDNGITSVSALSQVVPGLRIDSNGSYSQPSIRGVSSAVSGPGLSANVATYVDGFYRPDPIGNTFELGDVSSVQVLKGPQGTLFGRNATGGAILVTTEDPSFSTHGNALISYGNYNETRGSVFVTEPLTSQLAVSAAFFGNFGDGFQHNVVTGAREGDHSSYTARLKALYEPTNDIQITATYEHSYIDDPRGYLFNAYEDRADAALIPGLAVPTDRGQVANNDPAYSQISEDDFFLKAKINFNWATLTSLTSWQSLNDKKEGFDIDTSYAPLLAAYFPTIDRTVTQEFDLASTKSGPLTWVTGFFYMHQNANDYLQIATGGFAPFTALNAGQSIDAYALFGDVTYRLFDNLYLTAGGRYHIDDLAVSFGTAPAFDQSTAHTQYSGFDPRVVARYEITAHSNIYASVSQGSKSGAYNANGLSTIPVRPEEILAYEVGYKLDTSNYKFQAAAFYYDYKDLQVNAFEGEVSDLLNAAKARVYGAEAHIEGRLTDNLRFDLGGAYTHGTYDSFPAAPHYVFSNVTGLATMPGDASGNELERSPEFSGNVGLTYHQQLMAGNFELTGNYAYQTKVYFDAFEDTHQAGYGLLNLRASWTEPQGRWTIAAYGRNVTDQKYITSIVQESITILQTFGQPATYGAELSMKF